MSQKVIRILSVGNSYSMDQQTYVHAMTASGPVVLETVNAYIGGCTFRRHVVEFRNNGNGYDCQRNGMASVESGKTLREILALEPWDYITFQNGTEALDHPVPAQPYLSELMALVSNFCPQAKLVYDTSWVDCEAEPSHRPIFTGYFHSSRDEMREAWYAHEKAGFDAGFRLFLPAGVAMDEAFAVYGPRMHRDGFHASELGRYLFACVWHLFFLNAEIPADFVPSGNTYGTVPAPTEEERAVLRECAKKAMERVCGLTPDTQGESVTYFAEP